MSLLTRAHRRCRSRLQVWTGSIAFFDLMKRWKDPEIRQLHLSPIEKSVDNFQTYLAVRLSQNLRFLFVLHQSRIVSDCMDDKKCAARYEPFVPWRSVILLKTDVRSGSLFQDRPRARLRWFRQRLGRSTRGTTTIPATSTRSRLKFSTTRSLIGLRNSLTGLSQSARVPVQRGHEYRSGLSFPFLFLHFSGISFSPSVFLRS